MKMKIYRSYRSRVVRVALVSSVSESWRSYRIRVKLVSFVSHLRHSSDLYEEILKPNKSYKNCIIQIVQCKTGFTVTQKLTNFPACYLYLSLSEQVVYFHKTDIIALYWVIIYSYL